MNRESDADAALSTGVGLRRALSLRDLVIYGVIIVSITAPAPSYGLLMHRGHGHAALAVLIALLAMLPTALSYGRMASLYPHAGSAFAYVSYELNPLFGYMAGWGMIMDYLLNPIISLIWVSQQAHVFYPAMPYWVWTVVFASLATGLTAQGIRASAKTNLLLAVLTCGVVVVFFGAVVRYVFMHWTGDLGQFTRPFYDPTTWDYRAVAASTSLAMLTYIGFDGISTLAEESYNPRRDVPRATVLTCLFIGVISVLQVYGAQLVWPSSEPFPNLDTAFTFTAERAWKPLFAIVGVTLSVALFAVGVAAQLALARLLYGMGRSSVLPRRFFGAIHSRSQVPRNNVVLVGALALAGSLLLPAISGELTGYELGGNLVNFGALVAFMGVNAAAFVRSHIRGQSPRFVDTAAPVLGFVLCVVLWWNLSIRALAFGAMWMLVGIAVACWRTRGFRRPFESLDLGMGGTRATAHE